MRKNNNITKTLRQPIAGAALCAVVLAGVLSSTGCQKLGLHATKGDGVLFSAGLSSSESGTKTAYDGTAQNEINWLGGDLLRIWCRECSEPTTESYGNADHWADYTVTPKTGEFNKATIAVKSGTVGLRWGEEETNHYFYAVYPSPLTTGKTDDTWELGTSGTPTPFTFTGHIPATQTISGNLTEKETTENEKTVTTTIAAPDMANLYMVSKAEATPESDSPEVFLRFTPLSTAIQFTIENAMTADGAKMQVESVKIMSDPKAGSGKSATNLSGAFRTTLSDNWTTPPTVTVPAVAGVIGGYTNTYPVCTEPDGATNQSSAITIDFKNTSVYTEGIAKGDRLEFTFFLLPTQSVDDLSFVITRKDGENGTKTIKTRLEMADGTGIPFPKHKKTYVKGILVPDSAQWTIQYTVDVVTPWGDNPEDIPFYYPDIQEITTVTSWEDVPCDPGFEKK